GARRDNNGGRNRRDDTTRQEPAVRNPREPQNAPVIIRKESKLDRYPTPEQLDDLPSRPRGERPALLTRKG
ncbi:DEAD/DEAH box helicase, partial [Pseudomonas entomophila]|nr:DEAD/DEAH box helicase [Pseudomonas entomophila]